MQKAKKKRVTKQPFIQYYCSLMVHRLEQLFSTLPFRKLEKWYSIDEWGWMCHNHASSSNVCMILWENLKYSPLIMILNRSSQPTFFTCTEKIGSIMPRLFQQLPQLILFWEFEPRLLVRVSRENNFFMFLLARLVELSFKRKFRKRRIYCLLLEKYAWLLFAMKTNNMSVIKLELKTWKSMETNW